MTLTLHTYVIIQEVPLDTKEYGILHYLWMESAARGAMRE